MYRTLPCGCQYRAGMAQALVECLDCPNLDGLPAQITNFMSWPVISTFWTNNMNQCCFLSVGVNTFFYFPGWSQPPFFSWIHQPTPPSLAFQLLLEVTKTAPSEHRCAWARFLGTEGIWRMEGESRWYPGAVAEVLVITGRTPKIGFWKISDRNWLWQCWGLIWVDLDFGYRKKVNQHSLWQTLIGS